MSLKNENTDFDTDFQLELPTKTLPKVGFNMSLKNENEIEYDSPFEDFVYMPDQHSYKEKKTVYIGNKSNCQNNDKIESGCPINCIQ